MLSLEAVGQRVAPDAFLNLANFKEEYGPKWKDPSEQTIKPALLPGGLRNLFVVERESESANSPYKIGTKFPELLYAILRKLSISPLSKKGKTSSSLAYSREFYDECIDAISKSETDGAWSKHSFTEFYLFERLFRLNAKFTLACYEYNLEGERTLSPEFLRELFFHSPLVIFPPKLLGIFCGKATEYSVQKTATQFLHFLIQLSAYWFPCILLTLRRYMQDNEIQSFCDVCKFFFPDSKSFEIFQKTYTPNLKKLPSYELFFPKEGYAQRGARDTFSKRWSEFRPCPSYCAEAYTPWLIDDWTSILHHSYQDPIDSAAAKDILCTLS